MHDIEFINKAIARDLPRIRAEIERRGLESRATEAQVGVKVEASGTLGSSTERAADKFTAIVSELVNTCALFRQLNALGAKAVEAPMDGPESLTITLVAYVE